MNKGIISIFIIGIMLISIACGKKYEPEKETKTVSKNNKDGIKNANIKKILIDKTENKKEQSINVSIGERVLIADLLTFYFEEIKWTNNIKPSNTNGSYTYYNKKPGEIYYLFKGSIKNLSSEIIDLSKSTTNYNLKINDKLNYKGDFLVDYGTGFESTLKPLKESIFYIYVSVPEEAKEIMEKYELKIELGDDLKLLFNEKHS